MKKPLIISTAAASVILAGGIFGIAHAASTPGSLAQKLATTFHLDASKVQAVIDQNRADNQANRETSFEARLAQAVTAGQLTSAQKDAILAEHTKLTTELQASTDRRTTMEQVRTEAQTWAKANNIDAKWLLFGGMHHGGMHGMMDGDEPTEPTS